MRSFLKKSLIKILCALALLTGITLVVIALVVKDTPEGPTEEEKITINVSYENNANSITMNVISNLETSLVLSYKTGENIETANILLVENELGYYGEHHFFKSDEIYLVNEINLSYNEKIIYSKESITIFALINEETDSNGNNNGNVSGDGSQELVEITGEKIDENNQYVKIAFYTKEKEMVYNGTFVLFVNEEIYDIDEYIEYSNGYITIDKKGLQIGKHSLKIAMQKNNLVGEFTTEITVKNDLFINLHKFSISNIYYVGATEFDLSIIVDLNNANCLKFKINNNFYGPENITEDIENNKKIYSLRIMVDEKDIINNKVIFNLTEIHHTNGILELNEKTEYTLQTLSFNSVLETEKEYYVMGESKNVFITIENPKKVNITKVTIDNNEITVNSSEDVVTIEYSESADGNDDVLTSITYLLYEKEMTFETNVSTSHHVKNKIESYKIKTDFVDFGSEFIVEIELSSSLNDNEDISFNGVIDLFTTFNNTDVTYEINDNQIYINLTNLIAEVGKYEIIIANLYVNDENTTYCLIENEVKEIIYSGCIYDCYEFLLDKNEYQLYFRTENFEENLVVKRISYILYDANDNVIRELTTSNVYTETVNGLDYYRIMGVPLEAKYIKIEWIDYELYGEPGQISKFLNNLKSIAELIRF